MSDTTPDPKSPEVAQHVVRLRFSVALLRRNYTELVVAIRHITNPRVAHDMGGLDDRWHRHEAMVEVVHLLHNFVASAKSLVDHTRRVYRKLYKPGGLIPAYQREIDARFVNDPLSQFIEDLREMAQHYRLPSISFSTAFTATSIGAEMQCSFQLKREDLCEYRNWTAPARAFLEQMSETVDLLPLIERYYAHVVSFHDWFESEQAAIHGRGPTILDSLIRHGTGGHGHEIYEVGRRVEALTTRPRDQLTFADLHEALIPALTIWDSQRLALCRHDAQFWLSCALDAIERRFAIPESLRASLTDLIRS